MASSTALHASAEALATAALSPNVGDDGRHKPHRHRRRDDDDESSSGPTMLSATATTSYTGSAIDGGASGLPTPPSQGPPGGHLPKFLNPDDVIIQSTLRAPDPVQQMDNIAKAFNKGKRSIMVDSLIWGTRIDRGQFRLVHRNFTPELVLFKDTPQRKSVYFTGLTGEMGTFPQTDPFFGGHGVYVLNVPQGQLALAMSGTIPVIYGEGPHVIHDQNFMFDRRGGFRAVYHPYICHGTIHILRVPNGKIAKVWYGSEPFFLESRMEPYIVNSPIFQLDEKEKGIPFHDAQEPVILHGSLKRLMPRTGEVAITYDNGHLQIYSASRTNQPILITSPIHTFDSFLPTNIQTLLFPSQETKHTRKRENPDDPNFCYEVFRTKDGLPIGVQLLVVYEMTEPMLTLTKLNVKQIVPHIESLVVADMGAVIQQCSSSDFQSTDQTKARLPLQPASDGSPSAPEFIRHLQDEVKNQLCRDFLEYGINLVRLNIETPKILDPSIAAQVSKFSLITAQANADASVLEKQYQIAQSQANQKAEQERIAQERVNQNHVTKAKAAAEAKQIEMQATLESAKLEAEAIRIKAAAESEALQMKTVAAEKEAQLLDKYGAYGELRKAEIMARAMSNIRTAVLPSKSVPLFNFGANPNVSDALSAMVSSSVASAPQSGGGH
ncbi:vacuolin B [Pelomyxa schiedti]|nr:vacuolin B [Pelomyxa schiedti]